MKRHTRLLFLMFLLVAFSSGAYALVPDNEDPCPTYESCTIGGGGGCNPNQTSCFNDLAGYDACLPYKECIPKTYNSQGKLTYSRCEQSGERACARKQDNPLICGTLYMRHADCSRLN